MAKKSCGSDSKHEMKEYGKMPKGKSSGMKKPSKKSSKKMK